MLKLNRQKHVTRTTWNVYHKHRWTYTKPWNLHPSTNPTYMALSSVSTSSSQTKFWDFPVSFPAIKWLQNAVLPLSTSPTCRRGIGGRSARQIRKRIWVCPEIGTQQKSTYLEIHIMNNGSFGSFWPPRKHCENACLCLMKWELIGVIDLAQGAQLLNGWDIYIYRDTIIKYI